MTAFFSYITFTTKHLLTTLRTKMKMTGSPDTSSLEGQCLLQTYFFISRMMFLLLTIGLVNGTHYAQTSEEWLKSMDQNMTSISPIMESTYGKDSAVKWTAY
ncbi:uncharacterized protein LOC122646890 [Telopea speciosissima]|uniref:uncharacterized protein LOC122646890 n=1 Tax=Telopea speciosissima TaxID=54955 RepID=UPI001CC5A9C4|nr:uncharacterized protein LOC122646890 [Telopea speciosissima]